MIENRAFVKTPPVLTIEDVDKVQDIAELVYVDEAVKRYIARIVDATRNPEAAIGKELGGYVRLGASPRATIAFLRIAKAVALMKGRTHVIPEDVQDMRHQILRHRIALNYAAVADGVPVEAIINSLVASVKTP